MSSWKALCGIKSFETATPDTQTLNLSRNVSKFYARQVVSDDRAAKPKFAAFLSPTRSLLFGTTSLSLKVRFPILTRKGKSLNFCHYVTPIKPRSHVRSGAFLCVRNSLHSCIYLPFSPILKIVTASLFIASEHLQGFASVSA